MISLYIRDIVMDNPPENTKSINDMVFDEVNYATGFNFCERYDFRTLWEVINYCKDESMTSSLMEDWWVL